MPSWHGATNGWLEVEYQPSNGSFVEHYTLRGGPIVRIGDRMAPDEGARVFTVGAYRLRRLGYDMPHYAVIAVHIDARLWQLAVVRYWLEGINKRILATCYVWGLADYPIEREQVWGDVYPVQWARRFWGRLNPWKT